MKKQTALKFAEEFAELVSVPMISHDVVKLAALIERRETELLRRHTWGIASRVEDDRGLNQYLGNAVVSQVAHFIRGLQPTPTHQNANRT